MWNCRHNSMLEVFILGLVLMLCLSLQVVFAQEGPKDATEWTRKVNRAVLDDPILKWADKKDFENAQRGFIAKHSPLTIRDANSETSTGECIGQTVDQRSSTPALEQRDAQPVDAPDRFLSIITERLNILMEDQT